MTQNSWLAFLSQLSQQGIAAQETVTSGFLPARRIELRATDWARFAQLARDHNCRYVAGWADDDSAALHVWCSVEKEGQYLLAHTTLAPNAASLPSQANVYAGAARSERHTQDLLGVRFTDHPDPRRWTRHQAWTEEEFPLRQSFPLAGHPPAIAPPDDHYPFVRAEGGGVYEIPVGPVHAGIIEPGHFRFQAVGETVLNLEEHLGYVHKGIEKLAVGRDVTGLARLAGRVSGDSTVGHTWAACMAMERAANATVPARANGVRAILAERERIANHLGDIGAVCNDVAFTFAFYQFSRLRERWLRTHLAVFGHRLLMDCIVPGGVARDIADNATEALRRENNWLRAELKTLYPILKESPSLEDRLVTAGYLSPDLARDFGTLGYVARASGIDYDLRRDAPYAPYDQFKISVPVFRYGDVAARNRVRMEEILISLDLIDRLLDLLPSGDLLAPFEPAANSEGLGLVEGWRGEILTYVRFDRVGRIARFYPRDPSVMNWPALEKLVRDNIVPDFPVCNKSVNGSYSGSDL